MVARDIGETTRRDAQSVEPMLVEAVRRRFDRQMRDAVAGERVERAMQRDGIRRGERAVSFAARRSDADGADARGAVAECAPDLPGEGGDRSLTAGTGDGGDRARLAWKEFRRDQRQRTARIADARKSNMIGQGNFRPAVGDDYGRTGGDCGIDEAQAVRLAASNGDEHVAAFDRTAVRRHPAGLKAGKARVEFRVRRQNLAKLHDGPVENAANALPIFLERGQYQLIGGRQIEARLDAKKGRNARYDGA